MSRLDIEGRVYLSEKTGPEYEVPCQWFAKCENPANGLRSHPILTQVPTCQRCDDKIARINGEAG
ncbi:hypothetical protein ASE48_08510 [Mycobacterium sp. Root265]|nr:hypothetical protein ASE48_08510 [Mycobacterium sp. Root265]